MQYIKKLLILSLILTLIFSGCQSKKEYSHEISIDEKLEEYDELWEFLEENFSAYLQNLDDLGVDKDQLKNTYREKIGDSKDFDEYYRILDMLTREFKSLGHIEVFSSDDFLRMNETYKNFEQTKKEKENNNPAEIESAENSYKIYGSFFLNEASYDRYKEINAKSVSSDKSLKKIEDPSTSNLHIRSYEDEKTLYIKYKDFFDNHREANKKLIGDKLNEFSYDKVIVDIFGNPGGNSPLWWDIVSLLTKEPIKTIQYQGFQGQEARDFAKVLVTYTDPKTVKTVDNLDLIGYEYEFSSSEEVINKVEKIYIVQGENFSAAEEFCELSRDTGWATRIGQPIGGNGQGINYFYKLKNSNLLIRLAISYPSYSDGQLKDLTIEPDILMDYNVHDILDYVFNDEI